MVRRWHQLPLDHALSRMSTVRVLLDDLTEVTGAGHGPVPDLGPGVVMDQLTVLVYDACVVGRGGGLDQQLADLRRALA